MERRNRTGGRSSRSVRFLHERDSTRVSSSVGVSENLRDRQELPARSTASDETGIVLHRFSPSEEFNITHRPPNSVAFR
ncbi:hypothetical protein HMPREF9440_01780 [Sutterella parvirubra YIT 11816]|uniref:Uncharacterized protein n=1 Tax=Sutterella parvirubra YIT 11816 TaxID=762967 RepID=H3KGA1_9BURK|nr:hypothetical protein HMPREF9440_01780 [Sutterella parvirubra YIT 11816]